MFKLTSARSHCMSQLQTTTSKHEKQKRNANNYYVEGTKAAINGLLDCEFLFALVALTVNKTALLILV